MSGTSMIETGRAPVATATREGVAPDLAAQDVTQDVTQDVMVQLSLVVSAAAAGGLSGVDSEGALRVVEAVEAVKAWADSVSVAATAAMVSESETDLVHLAPLSPSRWGWTRFVRSCRTAAVREIQVATGLPVTQCRRRVWLAACEAERVGSVLDQMRLGRVSFARAAVLAEATAHLDAVTAALIAGRVLRPLTGPTESLWPVWRPCRRLRSGRVCTASSCCTTAWSARRNAPMTSPSRHGV